MQELIVQRFAQLYGKLYPFSLHTPQFLSSFDQSDFAQRFEFNTQIHKAIEYSNTNPITQPYLNESEIKP